MADASLSQSAVWVCRKCGSTERRPSGKGCGPCFRAYARAWREGRKALPEEERQKLRDQRTAKRRRRFAEDPACYEQYLKKDRAAQKGCREREKAAGLTKRAERTRRWLEDMRLNRPEEYTAYSRRRADYMLKRIYSSEKLTINHRMAALIKGRLKRGAKARRGWADLVGYTTEQLIARLKKTIPNGYTWGDFLSGRLHIDHKIPVDAFHFSTPYCHDFKRCFALKNLRLLPALENILKSNKLEGPFQPTLL